MNLLHEPSKIILTAINGVCITDQQADKRFYATHRHEQKARRALLYKSKGHQELRANTGRSKSDTADGGERAPSFAATILDTP